MNIYINGEEVVCESNFTITEEHLKTSSVILNKVYPKSWKDTDQLLTSFYFPKDYSSCRIYKNNVLIFSGITKNSGDMVLNPYKPHYTSVQILDYKTFLSEGNTLDFVISNKTIKEAINQVISSIANYGFIVGNLDIDDNTTIGAYSTLDKTAYDVLQYFAEVSGTLWKTRNVDEDTIAIDFYNPEDIEIKNIDYTQEYFEQNEIEDIKYSYSTNDYRNKQIILSDSVYANIDRVEDLYADGVSKSYIASDLIGYFTEILVNGVVKTFAKESEKNIGITADFYYTPEKQEFESENIYDQGANIKITYIPIVKGRQSSYNNNEVNRLNSQLGISGVIERYEKRNDVLSSDELAKVAQTYIKYNSKPEITLTIISRKSDLFNIGDRAFFNIDNLADLKTDYLVTKKSTKVQFLENEIMYTYTYELSNNFNVESEVNFFDNQRRKSTGNISENNYITRNIDIESQANIIFNNLTTNEINDYINNELDCELDFILIG
jgi:hypothetical protein